MRIISGKYKSRTLITPSHREKTRPTTDSARETIFNILENRIDFNGKICIDLFCGTGGFGIEFLSRGGGKCYFVDLNITLIKQNIEKFNIADISVIKKADARRFIRKFAPEGDYADCYIIFADPPYNYNAYNNLLESAAKINCIFILEHSCQFIPDKKNNCFILNRKTGITEFSIFDFRIKNSDYEKKSNSIIPRNI
ncbi:MAG: RsmD family RNA methyltransferase [Ignavibacteria bacterium]|nr:RsmD family RNA methyltransferase [Ignavibacteria bacterium]